MPGVSLVHFNHSQGERLTTWPDIRTSIWKPNYGDMLADAAIRRQIRCDNGSRVGFGPQSIG
jgi:hypothetical protein